MKGAGGGESDGALNELFKVNQVYYRMLPTLSLVSKRTLLVNSPNKSSYQGISDTITFIFNSGEFYVSGPTSYLYIQIGYNNPAAYGGAKALLSQGNAMALFEDITFTSASGTELCRELNKGLHESYTFRYNNTQEYIDTVGRVQGAPTGSYSRNHDGVAPVWKIPVRTLTDTNLDASFPMLGGSEGLSLPRSGPAAVSTFGHGCTNLNVWPKTVNPATGLNVYAGPPATMQLLSFCIPLDQVLGLFKPYMNTLIPSGIMAGGRLDLRLKDPTESLQFTAPAVSVVTATALPGTPDANLGALVTARQSALTVTRIYMVLDAYQMQDNVLKRLNAVQAGPDGMTYLFDSYDTVSNLTQGTGTAEFNIALARSRIVRSWNVVRDSANVINPYINSFCAEAAVYRACGKITEGAMTSTANKNIGVGAGFDQKFGFGGIFLTPLSSLNNTAIANISAVMAPVNYKFLQLSPPLPDDFDYTIVPGLSFPNQEIVSSYQAVLGSLYFPQQPLNTASEYYQNAQYVMSKCFPDSTNCNSVSYEDFKGGLGIGVWAAAVGGAPRQPVDPSTAVAYGTMVSPYGMAIYGMLAEKSQILELSGLPVSNARLLKHKFVFPFPTQSGYARRIDTFTQYTRALRVYLGGKVICRE